MGQRVWVTILLLARSYPSLYIIYIDRYAGLFLRCYEGGFRKLAVANLVWFIFLEIYHSHVCRHDILWIGGVSYSWEVYQLIYVLSAR